MRYDIVIIGAGPAGLSAARAAYDAGCRSILLLERDRRMGGILNQCIHNGFGLKTFHEELTGPEYADRLVRAVKERGIPCLLNTMVLEITRDRRIKAVNEERGRFTIEAGAIVLTLGCRERSRGALNIPGHRPAGIFTAGTAQRLVNVEDCMIGRRIVILGSGDIGLIMARRMTLEGARVLAVAELMPHSSGLKRNIVQCLEDYGIPLLLSHTVTDIEGKERLTGLTLSRVDALSRPIPGTERHYECDTLLISCGLIPENELTKAIGITLDPITNGPIVNEQLETGVEGIFAAGNGLHVHDLADDAAAEAARAGESAYRYVAGLRQVRQNEVAITHGGRIRYTVPSRIDCSCMAEEETIRFRVGEVVKKGTLRLVINGAAVASRRCPILTPGEMASLTIKKAQIPEGLIDSIHLDIEEA